MAQNNKVSKDIVQDSVLSEVEPVEGMPARAYSGFADYLSDLLKAPGKEGPLFAVGIQKDIKFHHMPEPAGRTFPLREGGEYTWPEDASHDLHGVYTELGDIGLNFPIPTREGDIAYKDMVRASGYDPSIKNPTVYLEANKPSMDMWHFDLDKYKYPYQTFPGWVYDRTIPEEDIADIAITKAHELGHAALSLLRKKHSPGFEEKARPLIENKENLEHMKLIYSLPFPFPTSMGNEEHILRLNGWLRGSTEQKKISEADLGSPGRIKRTFYKRPSQKYLLTNVLNSLEPGSPVRKQIDGLNVLSSQYLQEQGRPAREDYNIDNIVTGYIDDLVEQKDLNKTEARQLKKPFIDLSNFPYR